MINDDVFELLIRSGSVKNVGLFRSLHKTFGILIVFFYKGREHSVVVDPASKFFRKSFHKAIRAMPGEQKTLFKNIQTFGLAISFADKAVADLRLPAMQAEKFVVGGKSSAKLMETAYHNKIGFGDFSLGNIEMLEREMFSEYLN